MLKINGKTFMNLQEAVQWLLDNNALPFQCSANYIANTEIGLGTIVNPSPAKVRIGSLIFFADSKVSTVTGLTENGFIVSDQYNDLVDDIVYVSNVAINASGHLIVTLSNGDNIDAGLIKQVNSFSISASQHLIANYNDGTSTDLGAIFNGNVNIAGSLTADEIIENMSGYSFSLQSPASLTLEKVFAGVVKNGNKVTFVLALNITADANFTDGTERALGRFIIPSAVGAELYPTTIGGVSMLAEKKITMINASDYKTTKECLVSASKPYGTVVAYDIILPALTSGEKNYIRIEDTYLLSNPL